MGIDIFATSKSKIRNEKFYGFISLTVTGCWWVLLKNTSACINAIMFFPWSSSLIQWHMTVMNSPVQPVLYLALCLGEIFLKYLFIISPIRQSCQAWGLVLWPGSNPGPYCGEYQVLATWPPDVLWTYLIAWMVFFAYAFKVIKYI